MGVRYYVAQPDALYHHGTQGMKWYQRNGPPYPLQSFQKRAGNAVAKGKVAFDKAVGTAARGLKSATDYAGTKIREKHEANVAKRQAVKEARLAEQEEYRRRKAAAQKRDKLIKMAQKHPEWMTDEELDALMNRKSKEDSFKKAFPDESSSNKSSKSNKSKGITRSKKELQEIEKREKLLKLAKKHPERLTDAELKSLSDRKEKADKLFEKRESSYAKQVKNAVVKEVVTPYAVALGKAVVMTAIGGGDFQKIASVQISKMQQQSKSGNDNGKQSDKEKAKNVDKATSPIKGTAKKKDD